MSCKNQLVSLPNLHNMLPSSIKYVNSTIIQNKNSEDIYYAVDWRESYVIIVIFNYYFVYMLAKYLRQYWFSHRKLYVLIGF